MKMSNGYWFVETITNPYQPTWHYNLYRQSSYAFPTREAAERFALGQQRPDRKVTITCQEKSLD